MPGSYDLVTFVTDYGLSGGFVGVLHAVVDSIMGPEHPTTVIDLDHSIPRHDVMLGALRMEATIAYVRRGVHVGVVDPGVGSNRRPVAIESGGRVFVGPDNGLLLFAADRVGPVERAVTIERRLSDEPAKTFDGRDVFAPAAAHIARGMDLGKLGPALDPSTLVRLSRPEATELSGGDFELRVLAVDGFGNVQFGADRDVLDRLGHRVLLSSGSVPNGMDVAVGATFSDVAPGAALLYLDSERRVALALNMGRADELIGVRPGDVVRARPN